MKKRKELNALIGLGDSKRKKTKKCSGHRLLRTEPPGSESESSSEDEEFSGLSSGGVFRKSYTQCCTICYPLCVFIILAACVMACAGLIWMQIALKEDLDSLKEKLRTMESSQKASSHDIPKLSEELKAKQRILEDIESGDKGLNKLWSNLTEINRKISTLDSAVNHLKANIKSASDLITLPTTVEELQKSVATIGSTLTSVQHDVQMIQTFIEDQKKGENQQKGQTDPPQSMDPDDSSRRLGEGTENSSNSGSTQSSGSNPTRHPRFLNKNRAKRENAPTQQRLTLPGVKSVEDLEKLLQAQPDFSSGGVSYEDLRKIFGPSTPGAHLLEPYDVDRDHRYTLAELQAAIAL
ncbi:EF-hand calcium-binding domain-containing protein 14 [Astyanax mexicanus]|uniref:EF-hand calcium-binding domain-containing protein 14 n=1 Tax=Astyanax mexicanus TaxID=7994 RepID=UPI0020CB2175|nr:EF-hand calcium-binding domain-containing protein 14 [Astyanax mexicanus]